MIPLFGMANQMIAGLTLEVQFDYYVPDEIVFIG